MDDSPRRAPRPRGDPRFQACASCAMLFRIYPSQEGRKRFCSSACRFRGHERVQKACESCGAAFNVPHSDRLRARYCSKDCRVKGTARENTERAQVNRACPICGIQFITTNRHGGRKACSRLCANRLRAQAVEPQDSKVERRCRRCGHAFRAFPSRKGNYCSRRCVRAHAGERQSGKRRNAATVTCAWCGAEKVLPRCRAEQSERHFCDNACYHAWDKLRKSSPEMVAKQREQALHMEFPNPSGVELTVAAWMEGHGIRYEPQALLGRFARLDFRVGAAYVEVNGCYWHGCPEHSKSLTERQQRRQRKDRAVATYCARRGIPLFVIWEHDVRAGKFSALYPLLPEGSVI